MPSPTLSGPGPSRGFMPREEQNGHAAVSASQKSGDIMRRSRPVIGIPSHGFVDSFPVCHPIAKDVIEDWMLPSFCSLSAVLTILHAVKVGTKFRPRCFAVRSYSF